MGKLLYSLNSRNFLKNIDKTKQWELNMRVGKKLFGDQSGIK